MRQLKNKILSVLLACTLIVPIFYSRAFAVSEAYNAAADVYSQADLLEYAQALEIYKKIGAFDISKSAYDIVTREDFAYMINGFFGVHDIAEAFQYDSTYTDIGNSKYKNDIEFSVKKGYMSAYKNNTFEPEGYLTEAAVAQGLVVGLGYGYMSTMNYKNSSNPYETMANELKLFSKTKYVSDKYHIVYGELIDIFKEAITLDYMTFSDTGTGKNYYVSNGKNVLNSIYNCDEYHGIVTATPTADLYGGQGVSFGSIQIDGVNYHCDFNSERLLGYEVVYLIKNDKSDSALIYIGEDYESNDELMISASDIINYHDRAYSYQKEGSSQHIVKIPNGCSVIYNGRANISSDNSGFEMIPHNGSIRFLDNNKDGEYEVLFIENYVTMVVGARDSLTKTLYDKYTAAKELSVNEIEDGFLTIADTDGNKYDFEKIKENSVLSIAQSDDKKLCKIIVSIAKINGTIDEIDSDYITVDGTEYKVSEDLNNSELLKTGFTATLYLDKDSKVAYFEIVAENIEVVYMINAYTDDESDDNLKLKVLNADGKFEILACAERICIDDVKIKGKTKAYIQLCSGKASIAPEIISISKNSERKVARIYTVYKKNDGDCPANGIRLNSTIANTSMTYTSSTSFFKDYKTVLGTACKIFFVPDDVKNASEDEFYVTGISSLKDDGEYSSTQYPMYTYAVGPNTPVSSYAVINSKWYTNSSLVIVSDIKKAVDENGDSYVDISGYSYSSQVKARLYDDLNTDISKLSPLSSVASSDKYSLSVGDVIYYNYKMVGGNTHLTSINMVYDIETEKYLANNPSSVAPNASSVYYRADVYSLNSGYAGLVISGGNLLYSNSKDIEPDFDKSVSNYRLENISSASIYRYDSSGRNPAVLSDQTSDNIVAYGVSSDNYTKLVVFSILGRIRYCYIVNN